MLRRSGLLIAFATVFLQFAVFLQPLLPKQYQIAPVCELITPVLSQSSSIVSSEQHISHDHHSESSRAFVHDHDHHANANELNNKHNHHQHDPNHQCPYCTFYGHLIMPPELGIQEALVRVQVRLLAFVETFQHVYFQLQRLYLIPQGRAPPSFA